MGVGVLSSSASKLAWAPQAGPQTAYVNCPVFEVCYGGARGGGKTSGSLGEWLLHEGEYGAHARGLFVRRNLTDLEDTIEEARNLYEPLGAVWRTQKSEFRFPSGAVLRFRYLERDEDASKYQGHEYTRVYVEELTQFASSDPVMKLKGALRSRHGVPCGLRATCNPGGPGHTWVKQRYIDPGPWRIIYEDFRNPFSGEMQRLGRVFIPAKLSDNPILLHSDPLYVARLQQTGSAALVKAWLQGDWNIIEGAFFDCWDNMRHVIEPFEVPKDWPRNRSGDWGSAAPFSFNWWAINPDLFKTPGGVWLPRGCLVQYREWYGCEGKANVGLKMHAEEVGAGLWDRERDMPAMSNAVLDPSAFQENGGPSIAERIYRGSGDRIKFRRADNTRVAQKGAMGGWDALRARLKGTAEGLPMIVTFSTCRDSIRTIPALQHDQNRPEDVDTDGEDHAGDSWRYECLSRPWAREPKVEKPPAIPEQVFADTSWERTMLRRRQDRHERI